MYAIPSMQNGMVTMETKRDERGKKLLKFFDYWIPEDHPLVLKIKDIDRRYAKPTYCKRCLRRGVRAHMIERVRYDTYECQLCAGVVKLPTS